MIIEDIFLREAKSYFDALIIFAKDFLLMISKLNLDFSSLLFLDKKPRLFIEKSII